MIPGEQWERIAPIGNISKLAFAEFGCGIAPFDRWLRESAASASLRGECAVHVCIDRSGMPVAFFTLSSTSINPSEVSRGYGGGMHCPIPATLLGKMGVRTDKQGMGYGTRVVRHAMKYTLDASRVVSSRLLVVDALTPDTVPWYERLGFRKLPGSERRLVCKMKDIERICDDMPTDYFTDLSQREII